MKPLPKIVGLAVVGAALFGGINYAVKHSSLTIGKILVPHLSQDIPDAAESKVANVKPIAYPTTTKATIKKPRIKIDTWQWNAVLEEFLANGGNVTMKGSLNEKYGANVEIIKQNDTNQMVADLLACAQEIHGGAEQCSTGANLIVIMGDQYAEVAAQLQSKLQKIGDGLSGFGAFGYSQGEDACMLPQSFKDNPKSIATTLMYDANGNEMKAHGIGIAGSIHEGDWDICMKGGGDNAIPNNPNPKTWDADAFNWFVFDDYVKAGDAYVAGQCEDRQEVHKGKLTGQTVHVCINGVASWTPVDVNVATKRGGLVKAFDSAMYNGMMPALVLGPKKFINANREEIKAMMKAAFAAGDQIKAYPSALQKATEIEAKVYDDEGGTDEHGVPYTHGAYWLKYFHPVLQKDKTGVVVSLGGSRVNNLADNLILFGFDGNNNNAATTYTIFRDVNLQQYPEQYKASGETPLPLAKDVLDRTIIRDIEDEVANGDTADAGAAADVTDFSKSGSGQVVSGRDYSITFATGSSQPTAEGEATLRGVLDSIAITGLKVQIDGYTDNTGSAQVNTALSDARAKEVKLWLQSKAHKNFPDSRFRDANGNEAVKGHGPADPVGDNSTDAGRAANRRVHITLIN